MIDNINALPKPLKIVCWLQMVLAASSLVLTAYSITASDGKEVFSNVLNIVIPIIAVMGIIQRSKLIRMLLLIFSILGVIGNIYLMTIIVSVKNLGGLVLIIPLVIACITIWGLTHREAKEYFGV